MKNPFRRAALCFFAIGGGAQAFLLAHHHQQQQQSPAARNDALVVVPTTTRTTTRTTTSQLSARFRKFKREPPHKLDYGEESRKYRRDVYTHEDWVNFRSEDRFLDNLLTMFGSGIQSNISKEVLISVVIAIIICIYNSMVGEYTDLKGYTQPGMFKGMLPLMYAPLLPFSLTVSSLGLLLVFRTNQSYNRWDEARKNWAKNINHSRDLVRMGSAYYDRTGCGVQPERIIQQDLERLSLCTWAFVRAMKRHLSPEWEDEEAFRIELREKLPLDQANVLIKSKHRPNRALQDLSFAIEALPMNLIRKNKIQKAATVFADNLGSCERLLSSPLPLFYSQHSARFLALWLFLLPLGLYGEFRDTWNHIGLIPCTAAISTGLFSIDELATQLEEPFTILPMQAFCDKIYHSVMEIASWEPNDNEMFDDEYLAEISQLKKTTSLEHNGFHPQQQRYLYNTVSLDDAPSINQRSRLRSLMNMKNNATTTVER